MEFTLTISQKQIHENFPTLDIKDAAIIDFLGKFSHECDKKVYGKTVYYWFAYSKICDECPLLRLDPESVRRRMRGLCSLNILAAHPGNRGGKVFFAFGEKYSLTHRDKSTKGRAENPEVEKRSGRKSRPRRAENPELMAKGRANLPDNHNNHLDHNNQSSTESESAAACELKIEVFDSEFPGLSVHEILDLKVEEEKDTPSSARPLEKEKEVQPARPAPGESAPRRWDVFDIDREADLMKSDFRVFEKFAKDSALSNDVARVRFPLVVDEFIEDQKAATYNYQNTRQIRAHFFNWIITAPKAKAAAKNRPGASAHTPQPAGTKLVDPPSQYRRLT